MERTFDVTALAAREVQSSTTSFSARSSLLVSGGTPEHINEGHDLYR